MAYDFSQIGLVIKELRGSIGMNQLDLCQGICTQPQLSKIESGDATPLATTLYLISNRLGVSVNYIFEMTAMGNLDYILEFKRKIRTLVREKNYSSILDYVNKEEKNPNFKKNQSLRQFLLWHKAISIFYLKNESVLAIKYLYEALSLTTNDNRFYIEQEIEILNSIGVIYFEIDNYVKAIELYESTLKRIRKAPGHSYSKKVWVRLLYNLVKSKTALKDYEEAISLSKDGVELCIESESLYLLGELNYYIGLNYNRLGQIENSILYLKRAKATFQMTKRSHYIEQIIKVIEEISTYK